MVKSKASAASTVMRTPPRQEQKTATPRNYKSTALMMTKQQSINLVIDTLRDWRYLIAIIFDVAFLTFPVLFAAIYSKLSFEAVQIVGGMPSLLMICFSTTFSPGSGIPGLKALRYLFPRFYFWCMVPVVQDQMEGCPEDGNLNLLYIVLSSLILVTVFGMALTAGAFRKIGNYFENWIGQCGFRQYQGQKPGFRCRRLPRPLGIWLWRQECELLA